MQDERFARSVIYLCAHSAEGAMGIVLTRPAPDVTMPDLLVQLEIIPEAERIQLPPDARLHGGADRRTRRDHPGLRASFAGFSHGAIDAADRRRRMPDRNHRHPSRACARRGPEGRHPGAGLCGLVGGPARKRDPGQWLAAIVRPIADLLFGTSVEARYDEALRRIGVEPAMLSGEAGHA